MQENMHAAFVGADLARSYHTLISSVKDKLHKATEPSGLNLSRDDLCLNVEQGMLETIPETQPRLRDQLRRYIRDKHYVLSTERTDVHCATWYIRFHGWRHPANREPEEIRFLSFFTI